VCDCFGCCNTTLANVFDVFIIQHKDHKRREEYWAAGVGYGHHNRPGMGCLFSLAILIQLFAVYVIRALKCLVSSQYFGTTWMEVATMPTNIVILAKLQLDDHHCHQYTNIY